MAEDPLSVTANITNAIKLTGDLVSLVYEYIWGVNSVPYDLQQLTDELQSFGKVLASLRNHAKADPNPQSSALQEINARGGPLRQCAMDLKRLRLRIETGGGLLDNMKRPLWPLKVSETMQHISWIQKHKNVFTLLLQFVANRTKLSQILKEYVQDKNDEEPLVQNAPMQATQTAQERKNDLDWLHHGDFESRHLEIRGRRKANTGEWLPEAPEFEGWVKGGAGYLLLWGRGIPGTGKTFLSSVAIDHLQAKAQTSNYGVAYIYFDYIEQGRQQPKHVLASLIKQLTCQAPSFSAELEKLYALREIEEPSFGKLYETLLEKSKLFSRVFLVFDGLDECDQESQLKHLLPLFYRLTGDNINVFVTSQLRPGDIQTSLQNAAKIDLSAKAEDIKAYIQQKLDENPYTKRLVGEEGSRSKVIGELTACANRLFLLARLHIEIICRQPTVRDMLKELKGLEVPSKDKSLLDTAYDKVIERIRRQDTNCVTMASKIFMWLAKAQRTLTVDELQEAVSVTTEHNQSQLDKLGLPDRTKLLDICAGLVTIDEGSNTVRFTHYTTQKYLLKSSILPADADFQIAKACIAYLSFDAFSSVCESLDAFKDRFKVHRFFAYATKYLSIHIRACDLALTKDIVSNFVYNKAKDSYMQAIYPYRKKAGSQQSGLIVVSAIGHLPVVSQLLEAYCNEMNTYSGGASNYGRSGYSSQKPKADLSAMYRTALFEAVRGSHIDVIKLLIEGKPDASVKGEDGRIVLHWAARKGHNEIIKLLLGYSVSVSNQDLNGFITGGRTALHEAVRGGHKDSVELLLTAIAVNSYSDKHQRSALHWAALEGQEEIVELLLKKGAYVSAQDKYCQTALHLATSGGHEQVVQLLLKNSANVLAETTSKVTALHEAAYRGYKNIAHHLLEKGANISAKDKYGRTALSIAAGGGHKEVVQLLLENDANILAQTEDVQATLHEAVYGGHKETIQLLIDKGINISALAQKSLFLAARRGHKEVVQLFLENGADIWAQGDIGRSALHQAACGGHKEIVQLLLGRDADIWAQGTDGRTALHLAASEGHEQVVQLLLENGADIPVRDKDKQTPLHLASCGPRMTVQKGTGFASVHWSNMGHEKVVDLLLKHGSNPADKDKNKRTALHLSAQGGNRAIVQLLLENGARISDRDFQGKTALHLSAYEGHYGVVEMLLNNGADVTIRDSYNSYTALDLANGRSNTIVELLKKHAAKI